MSVTSDSRSSATLAGAVAARPGTARAATTTSCSCSIARSIGNRTRPSALVVFGPASTGPPSPAPRTKTGTPPTGAWFASTSLTRRGWIAGSSHAVASGSSASSACWIRASDRRAPGDRLDGEPAVGRTSVVVAAMSAMNAATGLSPSTTSATAAADQDDDDERGREFTVRGGHGSAKSRGLGPAGGAQYIPAATAWRRRVVQMLLGPGRMGARHSGVSPEIVLADLAEDRPALALGLADDARESRRAAKRHVVAWTIGRVKGFDDSRAHASEIMEFSERILEGFEALEVFGFRAVESGLEDVADFLGGDPGAVRSLVIVDRLDLPERLQQVVDLARHAPRGELAQGLIPADFFPRGTGHARPWRRSGSSLARALGTDRRNTR